MQHHHVVRGREAAKNFPNVPQSMVETVGLQHQCAILVLGTTIFVESHFATARLSARPTLFSEPNKDCVFVPPLLVTIIG